MSVAEARPLHLTLFDLDGTLLPFDSDHAFGEFLIADAGMHLASLPMKGR